MGPCSHYYGHEQRVLYCHYYGHGQRGLFSNYYVQENMSVAIILDMA
jgi:hypothetical protein